MTGAKNKANNKIFISILLWKMTNNKGVNILLFAPFFVYLSPVYGN